MGKLIAVWGSPGSGKTTFSVKLAEALYNRSRGKSAVIVVFTDIVTPSMQYAYIYHVAREQQNETQLKLDSYVTRYAVGKYDALKQGEPWETYIDSSDLVDGAYTALGFPQNHGGVVEVEGKYVMDRPSITSVANDGFGVCAVYEIRIPFELFDREIAEITVPVTVVSQYKLK